MGSFATPALMGNEITREGELLFSMSSFHFCQNKTQIKALQNEAFLDQRSNIYRVRDELPRELKGGGGVFKS